MTIAIYYAENPGDDEHEEVARFTDAEGWTDDSDENYVRAFPADHYDEDALFRSFDGPYAIAVRLDEDEPETEDEQEVPPGNVPGLPVVDFHSDAGYGQRREVDDHEAFDALLDYYEERGWDPSGLVPPEGYEDDDDEEELSIARRRKLKKRRKPSTRRRVTTHVLLERGVLAAGDEVEFVDERKPPESEWQIEPMEEFWKATVTGNTGRSDGVRWHHDRDTYSFTGLTQTLLHELVNRDTSKPLNGYTYWCHPQYNRRTLMDLRNNDVEKRR